MKKIEKKKKKISHKKTYKIFLLILYIFIFHLRKMFFDGKFLMKLDRMSELNKF